MLRAFQLLRSSSGFGSSPLQRWKPLPRRNDLLFFSLSTTRSSSSSSRAAAPILFPSVYSSSGSSLFRSFRISAIRPDSNPDDASSTPFSSALQSLPHMRKVSFCQWCGAATKQSIPEGDDKTRAICTVCGKVAYQNPKMVVGCLVEHDNKVLLCKRKIPPAYAHWTLPSGYMEIGESAEDGAARETWEEAGAKVKVLSPFAHLDIPLIGTSYIFFRAKMTNPQFSPGPESLECRLFAPNDIPFDSLAFSSMFVALNLYVEDLKTGETKFHYCTINKRPGSGPSDIRAYTLGSHLQA